jgi:hypothetical protein
MGIFRIGQQRLACVRIGRVQSDTLGVIGRDGLFNDDGKFHLLTSTSDQNQTCGGLPSNGQMFLSVDGPPIPASGYTGSLTTPIGGCITHRLNPATTSVQTRRKLKGIPVCPSKSMRIVKYGFAGREATKVRYGNSQISREVVPSISGAYLFVLRASAPGAEPLRLTVTYRDGTVCSTAAGKPSTRDPACSPPPGF